MRSTIKLILLFLIFITSCSRKTEEVNETIIARVADKTISKNELIRRAEYTIRPIWCRNDNYIHQKIVLNSLIAEKIMALEAGPADELMQNSEVQAYLKGRKEQAMRQVHFNKTAVQQVKLSDKDLNTAYKMAERTYSVRMIPINNDELAQRIREDLKENKTTFDALLDEFTAATEHEIEEQKIDLNTPVDDAIYKALFMNDVTDEQVIGPLNTDKNKNVLIKVNGWIRNPVIGETRANQVEKDVRELTTEVLSRDIYAAWVAELMHGKKIQFNPETFEKFVEIIGPDYFKSSKDRENAFNKKFWNKDNNEMYLNDNAAKLEQILDKTLLTVDGETWTVRRFEEEVKVHPLVFRNRKMAKSEFSNEFRMAVADLIRDKYITADAYDKGFDENPLVERNVNMWEDNLLALYQRQKFLKDIPSNNETPYQLVTSYFDPYLDSLRQKYADQIFIDTDQFEKIKLTAVDMFVIQRNVPFPVVVPEFPQLTTHNRLDYGNKMEGQPK
ncbi:MAG: hypothetical protein KDF60_03705 [Calditrichaeota bacterium]|nr:hypothetical protein [Calditrichota bacterium]